MAYVVDAKCVLLICLGAIVIYNAYIYLRYSRKGLQYRKRFFLKSVFLAYIIVIISFTLLPILVPPMHTEEFLYNYDIRYLFNAFSDRTSLINVAGNVILFIPMGILGYMAEIPVFSKVKSVVLTSLGMSVLIETLQGLETIFGFADFPAVTDLNDVITNTLGGLIGFLLIRAYLKKDVR